MLALFLVWLFSSVTLHVTGQVARYNQRYPSSVDPYDGGVVCKVIGDDYINLITQHELLEINREKQKDRDAENLQNAEEDFLEEEGRQFLTMELMKEMRQVREKILNATLEPHTLFLWNVFAIPQQERLMKISGAVNQIYHRLRDLKIAEWNQETENEEFD